MIKDGGIMKNIIYIVEDDQSISDLYKLAFDNNEFEVKCFSTAESFFEELDNSRCDLILMDLMLPGMDGIAAIKLLKESAMNCEIPVIIVSAKGDEENKVRGLDEGADDYLAKPFGMNELIARVKANLRKVGNKKMEEKIYKYGDICVNDAEHIVLVNKNMVTLTLKEYNLLKLLMANLDNVVLRDDILSKVWGYEYFGETRTLDMHIKSLRSKLGVFTSKPYIATVRGVGYKFAALC